TTATARRTSSAQVPCGKLFRALALKQPLHRREQIVLVGLGHGELLGKCRRVPPAAGAELGVRGEHPRGDHCADPIALRAAPSAPAALRAQGAAWLHAPPRRGRADNTQQWQAIYMALRQTRLQTR